MKVFMQGNNINFKYARGNVDLYGKTFHSYYEIYLLLQGEVEYISPHTRHRLKPFQLIIIPPGEYHQFTVCGDINNYERCVINIEENSLEANILKEVDFSKKIFSLNQKQRIVQNFLYLKEIADTINESDYSRVLSAITSDISVLLKYCTDLQDSYVEVLSDLAFKTMNYIDIHYTESFDLNFLAEKMFCSVSLMCHEFKDNFGISIKKYILQKRMNQAKLDLKNGEKSESVSVKYGFPNYSSFYRAYKKCFGIAPSQTFKSE